MPIASCFILAWHDALLAFSRPRAKYGSRIAAHPSTSIPPTVTFNAVRNVSILIRRFQARSWLIQFTLSDLMASITRAVNSLAGARLLIASTKRWRSSDVTRNASQQRTHAARCASSAWRSSCGSSSSICAEPESHAHQHHAQHCKK